jgi:pyruvate kinase
MERRTKLIVSLGPSIEDRDTLRVAMDCGMDMARINMTHNTHDWHTSMIRRLREVAAERGRKIPVIMDIMGPSVRTGDLDSGGFIDIRKGDRLTLTVGDGGSAGKVQVNCPELPCMVSPGELIYIDDASVQLTVVENDGQDITCEAVCDSRLGSRRSLHVPGKSFRMPVLGEKDWKDLDFGIKNKVDYIGLSFVKTAQEIQEVREHLREKGSQARIIAKIETPEAVENLDPIIEASDAVLIARGDMGVALPLEDVPRHQYDIIRKCRSSGKFVITATEMLNSMKNSPRPTRAEVNDVYTAVASGSSAVMLSGETAEGRFPIEAITYMRKIADSAESGGHDFLPC